MPDRDARRRDSLTGRPPKPPSERDWERADLLDPLPGPRHPELISDGGGLPFPTAALAGPPGPLDPEDPAAAALLAHLTARAAPKRVSRTPWKRGAPATAPPAPASLEGWQVLARSRDEVLFARGFPPRMLTMAFRQDGRRGAWSCFGSSAARPLRATRDGIRASSWRLDPTHEAHPDDTVLRVLVSEQSFASGQRANGRVLPPEIYVDADELVLTIFVTPKPGFHTNARNPETPVRIALPHPVGPRRLIDGALTLFSRADPPPAPGSGD